MREFHSQNIYVQNFLRSRNYAFSAAYSELLGRVCGVEGALTMRKTSRGFCEELLTALQGSTAYGQIDRISLVMRVGLSNELTVCDSHNSSRASENQMLRDYRCFVRPDSSLLSLREGEIRIYDEASRVAATFAGKQKPVQRSLVYVMRMGFQSGMCVPLHIGATVRGFLFINSVDPSLFSRLDNEDYAILSMVAMTAKLALLLELRTDDEYQALAGQEFAHFDGTLFDEAEFQFQLQAIVKFQEGESWRPTVIAEGDCDFLLSPTTLAFVVARICSVFYGRVSEFPNEIRVINCGDGNIEIRVPMSDRSLAPSVEKYRAKVETLGRQLSFSRATLSPAINHVAVKFAYDRVSSALESGFYSV